MEANPMEAATQNPMNQVMVNALVAGIAQVPLDKVFALLWPVLKPVATDLLVGGVRALAAQLHVTLTEEQARGIATQVVGVVDALLAKADAK